MATESAGKYYGRMPEVQIETDVEMPGAKLQVTEADSRAPRAEDARQADERPTNDAWLPASRLPKPNPVPGWAFRYIRTATLGNADVSNVSQKFREGWEPVRAEDHPEIMMVSDLDSRWPDGVEIGGQLLCKCPQETVDRRNKHFQDKATQQIETVDHGFMREQDPRMPLNKTVNKTRTTFGGS